MPVPALKISHISKIYTNGFHAVKDISFNIPCGQFTVLLGLNGAGKTSLIHMITGLSHITSGNIEITGYDVVSDTFEAKRHLGICPQEVNFNLFHSIEQELLIAAGLHNLREGEAMKRIEPLLKLSRLWPKKHELIRNLSGGMKRVLMVIRAMIHQPKLLLMDEPTAGVDIEIRDLIWDLLREAHKGGTSILLTTHNMQEAQKLCERVVMIHHGKLLRELSIKEALMSLSTQPYSVVLGERCDEATQTQLQQLGCRDVGEDSFSLDCNQEAPLSTWLEKIIPLGIPISDIHPSKNQLEQLLQEATQ